MQNVIQEFTVGFYDSSGVFSIYMKQHDTGRKLKFHLQDLNEDYAELLNDDRIAITLREQLPDGTAIPDVPVDLSNVDKEELSVTVPVTKDMIQQSGIAICDLMFGSLDDEEIIISTVKFKLIIDNILPVPESGYQREWFDTWSELYVSLKHLEYDITTDEERRVEAEAVRVSNEETRISNESARQSAETTRVSNEEARVSNEEARVTAETARDTAEQQREAAEQVRESRVQEQVDEAHMWADGMNTTEDRPSATNNAKFYALQAQAVSGIFNGTVADWNSLSLADKAKYQTVILTDD